MRVITGILCYKIFRPHYSAHHEVVTTTTLKILEIPPGTFQKRYNSYTGPTLHSLPYTSASQE